MLLTVNGIQVKSEEKEYWLHLEMLNKASKKTAE
jgi:hypothetical protein